MGRSTFLAVLALVLCGAGKPRTPEMVCDDAQRAIDAYSGNANGIEAAYDALEAVVAADPKNARAWRQMGTILNFRSCPGGHDCNEKLLKLAMEHFDRALALDPKMPEAILGRAWVFKYRRDDWGAEEAAKAALKLRPGWANALYLLGDIAKGQRRYDAAIDAGKEIVSGAKDPDALARGHGLLASAYGATEQYELAEESHRALIKLEPKNAWLKGNYAGLLLRAKRYDDAITQAKAALAIMNYGAARTTLKRAYRARAAQLRELLDEKGAQKYERLADAVDP